MPSQPTRPSAVPLGQRACRFGLVPVSRSDYRVRSLEIKLQVGILTIFISIRLVYTDTLSNHSHRQNSCVKLACIFVVKLLYLVNSRRGEGF